MQESAPFRTPQDLNLRQLRGTQYPRVPKKMSDIWKPQHFALTLTFSQKISSSSVED